MDRAPDRNDREIWLDKACPTVILRRILPREAQTFPCCGVWMVGGKLRENDVCIPVNVFVGGFGPEVY